MSQLKQQYEGDTLHRVVDFVGANAQMLGALATSEAVKQIDAAARAIDAHRLDQSTSRLALLGQQERKQSLTEALRERHMKPIASFSRTRLKGAPDIAALTRSGAQHRGWKLVSAARAMATAAAPHVGALVQGGFPADVVAQLATTATALDDTMRERANTKLVRVGATSGITQELRKGRDGVRMLDAVIRQQFGGNAAFMASWRVAKRVVRTASASAGSVPVSAPVSGPVVPAVGG